MISQTSAHELKIGKGKPEFKLDWQNFDATAFEASRIQFQNAAIALTGEKTCPRCAETVKAAAKVCKHCGHEFEEPQA